MARHTVLPPFLQKLKMISQTISKDIADWHPDGASYVVKNSDEFELVLKQHFKGNLQTFIRQLHFYGFKKLDAHNGGWSFVHKNFRRDMPDLLADIRRKTRSDPSATAGATQVEVQQLRTQVAQLQDVVEDLRTQLEKVIHVLDDAGVAKVTADKKANVEQATEKSRKRSRSNNPTNQDDFESACSEIEPLPMETSLELDMIDFSDTQDLYENLVLDSTEDTAEETTAEQQDIKQEEAGTAKLVADATEVDPESVQKVLGFIKKAMNTQKPGPGETSKNRTPSFPQVQNAILRVKKEPLDVSSLPAQEVGAN